MPSIPYVRLFGALALLGGALRLIATFIPYTPDSLALESFYFVIDIALIFGLIGIFAARMQTLGVAGLVGFIIALVGQVAILGPDRVVFGVSLYEVSVAVIALGLAIMAASIWLSGAYPRAVALFWIAAPLFSVGGDALGIPYLGFAAAGISYSAGFIYAGWITASRNEPDPLASDQ